MAVRRAPSEFARPTIPGDANFATSRVGVLFPKYTVGPYTSWKLTVKATTTGFITLQGLQTVDGVSLNQGDRVLVKDQGDFTNGIYVVYEFDQWPRASDLETRTRSAGIGIMVNQGTVWNNTLFVCTNIEGSDKTLRI